VPHAADTACTTDAARACLAELRSLAGGPSSAMERHCLRVFEIAAEMARRRGIDPDRELLLCAAWLHDAGLYPAASSGDAYVVDGRRLAERVVGPFGWPDERIRLLGDAIERHHELRPQWKLGAEVELMRRADLIDVSAGLIRFGLDRAWLHHLNEQVERTGMYREIGGLVGRILRQRPTRVTAIFLR
jgi:hypothetical protein